MGTALVAADKVILGEGVDLLCLDDPLLPLGLPLPLFLPLGLPPLPLPPRPLVIGLISPPISPLR